MPIPIIGTLLGHKSLRVTVRYARHAPEDATKRAIVQLQSWRNGNTFISSTRRGPGEDPVEVMARVIVRKVRGQRYEKR